MDRKELYNKVKELGIAEEVKKAFGDNYTRVSNANLEDFIKKYIAKSTPKKTSKATGNYDKAIIRLVSTLQARRCLTAAEANEILELL